MATEDRGVSEATYQLELTCIGLRRVSGGKWATGWMTEAGRSIFFAKPTANIGAVFCWTFTDPETTRAYTSGRHIPVFIRQKLASEEPRIREWEANHYAAIIERRRASQAKREQQSDLIEAMKPYRAAYHDLVGGANRAAYLATIIEAITRYGND